MALAVPLTLTQFPDNPKTLILQQCKTARDLNQIHAHLVKTRLLQKPNIAENILESAALIVPNTMDYAMSIFDRIEEPESSAFNVIIRGLTQNQGPDKALVFYRKMCENYMQQDEFTFLCVLKACSKLGALSEGEQVHAQVLKLGFGTKEFVRNSLIHMYASSGRIAIARKVFDELPQKGVLAWNSLFAGYSKNGLWGEILNLFRQMLELQIEFDQVTLTIVLTACGRLADLELGERIRDYIETNGLKGNLTLITSLVDMYAKCGNLVAARRLFDGMDKKDVVAWSAMISGYTQARQCKEAIVLFHQMQAANVTPNEVTIVSVLSCCAVLGALETGKWLHFFIKKKGWKLTVTLGTALIDFYAKCGVIESAVDVFSEMPKKNVFSWTALIHGLAINGQGKRALKFFQLMLEENVRPNDVTFIGVLSACNHAGLVDKGRDFFISMSQDFNIEPRMEHYGCMVDMLGRAGLIDEAHQFIRNMPVRPNAVIWRTLLGSCRAHKNVEVGEESVRHIAELEPMHSGDYILLSNLYASVGRLEDAMRVRNRMKENGITKTPGCSLIELDGAIHEFFSEDNSHSCSVEIYNAAEHMIRRIKSAGYEPNTAESRFDIGEDDKEVSLSHHSEKLAIAFALIKTPPGTTIRISKNLRVCADCHSATKIISKVFKRDIVVRDRNRFHHFKDGTCSCNDFW